METHSLAHLFSYSESVLGKLAEGMSAEDWLARTNGANDAYWVLGHLAVSRRLILRWHFKPGPAKDGWEDSFMSGRGPQGAMPVTVSELLREFSERGKELSLRLAEWKPEEAERKVEPYPDGGNTAIGGIRWLYMHEVYHLGQLSLLRRLRGKPGVEL